MNTIGWIMVNADGMPFTRNMYDLYQGYKELGVEVKTYNAADLFTDTIPYNADNIVVGHIDQCRNHSFKITGKKVKNLDYPDKLIPYMKRNVKILDLKSVYIDMTKEYTQPIFVKSYDQKVITGFVCNNFSDYVKNCSGHDLNTVVFVSDVVNILSEYRTYIHRHEIITSLRYKGDYFLAPDNKVIENMLLDLKNENMPIAYSIDVGILDTGETILIECNDSFALGNYGLPARRYAEMNIDRWFQMIEENKE